MRKSLLPGLLICLAISTGDTALGDEPIEPCIPNVFGACANPGATCQANAAQTGTCVSVTVPVGPCVCDPHHGGDGEGGPYQDWTGKGEDAEANLVFARLPNQQPVRLGEMSDHPEELIGREFCSDWSLTVVNQYGAQRSFTEPDRMNAQVRICGRITGFVSDCLGQRNRQLLAYEITALSGTVESFRPNWAPGVRLGPFEIHPDVDPGGGMVHLQEGREGGRAILGTVNGQVRPGGVLSGLIFPVQARLEGRIHETAKGAKIVPVVDGKGNPEFEIRSFTPPGAEALLPGFNVD